MVEEDEGDELALVVADPVQETDKLDVRDIVPEAVKDRDVLIDADAVAEEDGDGLGLEEGVVEELALAVADPVEKTVGLDVSDDDTDAVKDSVALTVADAVTDEDGERLQLADCVREVLADAVDEPVEDTEELRDNDDDTEAVRVSVILTVVDVVTDEDGD